MTISSIPMSGHPAPPRSDAVAEAEAMADAHLARQEEVERVGTLVRWLDDAIHIPGTRFGVGLDALVGMLVPVVGDVITGLVALRVMLAAMRRGVPRVVLARMLLNIGVDTLVGMLPVVGDAFDVVWRSNVRNLELLERHQGELEPRARAGDYAVVAGAIAVVAASIAAPVVALWWLIGLVFG
ncbi:MAG: DUF4112 domain-containing protein [Myxococcales bacterium]|nr:DUF4112 domain-containing protein [Myxococcales bacterium]